MPRVNDFTPRTLPPRRHTPTANMVAVTTQVQDGWANTCEDCDHPFYSTREDARYCTQICGERARNKMRPRNRY